MNCVKAIVVCGTAASALAAWAGDEQAIERRILEQEAAWGRAMASRDVETLSGFMADDWTNQNESGYLVSKSSFLQDVKSGNIQLKSFTLHDLHVRILGDVVVVQGSNDEVSSYAGTETSGTYNWTDVWHKVGDKWISVATQLTRVTTPAAAKK